MLCFELRPLLPRMQDRRPSHREILGPSATLDGREFRRGHRGGVGYAAISDYQRSLQSFRTFCYKSQDTAERALHALSRVH